MSKMREALNDAWLAGYGRKVEGSSFDCREADISPIASHYGDLEFTREEVRGMLEEALAWRWPHYVSDAARNWIEVEADRILSRHTEGESESGDKEHTLDREVGETQGELIALTKRVAAIEKRLLADGHAEGCERINLRKVPLGSSGLPKCTCGHDEVQSNVSN